MRTWLAVPVLCASACVGARDPAPFDPTAHGRVTAEGFREASPFVADRLDAAFAWAVFPDVEDTREACVHEGWLFRIGAPAHPAQLRCATRPTAPAGAAYHVLVILEDPDDVDRLAHEGLDLTDSPHLSTHDEEAPLASSKRWVVTSARGGLLFDPWRPHATLELWSED